MKIIICYSLFLIILFSCKKEKFNIENLNGNKITALGHAGMGINSTYPMDSYESILKCLNLGMDGSEFDVQMTKDSVLVAFHDEELSEKTNLQGLINSLSWEELKKGHYTQIPYLNYSIISLNDLFSNIANLQQYKYTFDCKMYPGSNNLNQLHTNFINKIIELIEKFNIENNVFIESQNEDFLIMLKKRAPSYKLFIYTPIFENSLNIANSLGLYGITISTRNITKEQIKIAHDNNLLVAIWNTHTTADNIEGINKNPDFIQTDKVENLIKLLKNN